MNKGSLSRITFGTPTTLCAMMCAALLLACGSDAQTSGPGNGLGGEGGTSNPSAGGGNASTGGGNSSAGGAGGGFTPGSGNACNPADAYLDLTINGQPVPHAEVENLYVAPNQFFNFCYAETPGPTDPSCDIPFTVAPVDDLLIEQPNQAFAVSESAGWPAVPGSFTLTPFTLYPTITGTFSGTVNDGEQDLALEGTFQGCPLATE